MFNNPFDSFQNTVAKAKSEREQLDRLLTISTSKERLLVVASAVVLIVFTVWLWFGNVSYSIGVDGVLIGSIHDNRSVQALIWVNSNHASQFTVGMPTMVVVETTNQTTNTLRGKISEISTQALSAEFAQVASQAPVFVQQIILEVEDKFDLTNLRDKECRIVIQLGELSPIALFKQSLK